MKPAQRLMREWSGGASGVSGREPDRNSQRVDLTANWMRATRSKRRTGHTGEQSLCGSLAQRGGRGVPGGKHWGDARRYGEPKLGVEGVDAVFAHRVVGGGAQIHDGGVVLQGADGVAQGPSAR